MQGTLPTSYQLQAKKLVIIMGPTGAGKSALALPVAKQWNGEIINADSRQIYAGMTIGTDKVGSRRMTNDGMTKDEGRRLRDVPVVVQGIPHYLLDILTPDQRYSAGEFRDDARRIIADVHRRGKLPIVVGGTGFYVRALTGDQELPNVPPDPDFRAWAETQSVGDLAAELRTRAPELYAKVDNPKNRRRVTRYLEIARGRDVGQKAEGRRQQGPRGCVHPSACCVVPVASRILKLAFLPPLPVLRERIEARVDAMLVRGLVDEARRLARTYGASAPGLQTTGYRQVIAALVRSASSSEIRDAVIRAHWNTARRQIAWLKTEPHLVRVETPDAALAAISAFLVPNKRGVPKSPRDTAERLPHLPDAHSCISSRRNRSAWSPSPPKISRTRVVSPPGKCRGSPLRHRAHWSRGRRKMGQRPSSISRSAASISRLAPSKRTSSS